MPRTAWPTFPHQLQVVQPYSPLPSELGGREPSCRDQVADSHLRHTQLNRSLRHRDHLHIAPEFRSTQPPAPIPRSARRPASTTPVYPTMLSAIPLRVRPRPCPIHAGRHSYIDASPARIFACPTHKKGDGMPTHAVPDSAQGRYPDPVLTIPRASPALCRTACPGTARYPRASSNVAIP
jgi:hypothetical protein